MFLASAAAAPLRTVAGLRAGADLNAVVCTALYGSFEGAGGVSSAITSSAALSSRSPLNEAWRSCRSVVQARNSISATSFGSTHFAKVACDVPGGPTTGKGRLAHLERVELLPNVSGGAVREASPGPPDVSELATVIFAEN